MAEESTFALAHCAGLRRFYLRRIPGIKLRVPTLQNTALGLFFGACAGWAVGSIEAALVGLGSDLAFSSPIADSIQIAWRFAVAGAIVGGASSLAPSPLRPTCAATRLAVPFLALAALCGCSWIHQELFAGTPMYAVSPFLATIGLGLSVGLCWKICRRVTAPLLTTFLVSGLSLVVAAMTSGQEDKAEVAAKPKAVADAPNVLFLLVDTLRADHLSGYGYGQPTSPNMDALGESGV